MRVTAFTRDVLAVRRQERKLTKEGYRRHETDWEIIRGSKIGERIVDAQISADGLYVYTETERSAMSGEAG